MRVLVVEDQRRVALHIAQALAEESVAVDLAPGRRRRARSAIHSVTASAPGWTSPVHLDLTIRWPSSRPFRA
ncbi:MAG: hypothetical protein JJE40_18350 [Vicinamibacteria bacterium]|nr:hypothetical protein [Vicinamibacteria bacterium]